MKRGLNLNGKVALVTGAAQGIGLEMSRQLYGRGARVVLVDRDIDRLAEARRALAHPAPVDTLPSILTVTADVTDRAAMQAAIHRAMEVFGRLDVVIANAGVTPPPSTISTLDPNIFDRVIDINLTGALNTVHPALAEIIRSQGHVVIVSSSAAYCPGIGGAAYMASKAASEQLGRALRLELAPHGATGAVAYFGFVDTELARETLDRDPFGARIGQLLPWPMNRRVSAKRAAAVVVRGIERRAPRTTAPAIWAVYSLLRGIANPLIDRALERNPAVHNLITDLENRVDTHKQ